MKITTGMKEFRSMTVNEINDLLIERFAGMKENNTMRVYTSLDRTIDEAYQADYEDFLNSICPIGLPPHKLILKKNFPNHTSKRKHRSLSRTSQWNKTQLSVFPRSCYLSRNSNWK